MKVLISSESYWPNKDGGAVFEERLVGQLIADGHKVCVLVPGVKWRKYEEDHNGSHIYRTASMPLPLNKDGYRITYYAASQVKKVLHEFKPDIIHINTMAITGEVLRRYAKKLGIPLVATNHLMPENIFMSFPKFVQRSKRAENLFWRQLVRFHENFLAVSSPTPSAIQLLKEHGLTRPLFAISNGVDTEQYHPIKEKSLPSKDVRLQRFTLPSDRYIIYLGRVNAEKRIDMTVDGFAAALKKDSGLGMVIAGKGNRVTQLQKQCEELGIAEKVLFTGLVSDEEKVALLQHAQLYIITSPAELQSIATMEAMACGLPVIAVDIAALHELCHTGKNGYLIPLNDIEACSDAILKITGDPELQERFADYSRQYILDHHSHASSYKAFLDFYHFALKEARK